MARIAINGFGRIGRLVLRAAWPHLNVTHINEIAYTYFVMAVYLWSIHTHMMMYYLSIVSIVMYVNVCYHHYHI